MFILTRISAPKMFARFGLQTQTFYHKKLENAVAKFKSDIL